jgi:PqqD family protein of HPr-rel-A system
VTAEARDVHPIVRWCAAADSLWTHYDDGDDWVVYVPASADIHHMTASARQLWTLVSAGPPSSSDELAAKLATELRRPLDEELTTVTREALAFMDQAGLVRRVLT